MIKILTIEDLTVPIFKPDHHAVIHLVYSKITYLKHILVLRFCSDTISIFTLT